MSGLSSQPVHPKPNSSRVKEIFGWVGTAAGVILALDKAVPAIGVIQKPLPSQIVQDPVLTVLQWVVIGGLVVFGLVCVAWGRTKRSRLKKTEAFVIKPDEPRHLKGRADKVAHLVATCRDVGLFELTGESGSGKTAIIRSGLLPKLRANRHLFPIYVDSYGQDWEKGPRDNLAACFREELNDDLKTKLGLASPITAANTVEILKDFCEKTGRRPIVFFDQFDDYLVTHVGKLRAKLLTAETAQEIQPSTVQASPANPPGEPPVAQSSQRSLAEGVNPPVDPPADQLLQSKDLGNWLSSDELYKINAFWKDIADLLKEDKVYAVFVNRADQGAGLKCVRFIK